MQALWRLARSGSAAPDASVIAQLQTRGAALGVSLAQLLEDPSLEHGAAGTSGALAVAGLAAALTHDTPPAALFGSAVASHGGVPKVQLCRKLPIRVFTLDPATGRRTIHCRPR